MAWSCPTTKLCDGSLHPMLGFGTYKVGVIPSSASSAASVDTRDPAGVIQDAIDVGYRYFDCAEFYGNEKEVGMALAKCGVPREELYLVSKPWTTTIYNGADAVKKQLQKTLDDLQTTYIDLYLIHWPVPGKHLEAYKALEDEVQAGRIRRLGISNYTVEDYEELKGVMSIKPVVNQIEINPFLYRAKTIEYFMKEGIKMQAYRALRQAKAFGDEQIKSIAAKYDKSPAQILTQWCLQHDIIVLAKSAKKERMAENFSVAKEPFSLADDDMKVLDSLTTSDALEEFRALYTKCVVRDTPLDETKEGIKPNVTLD